MIVIVSGLPRSGTSMVMQMLAAGGLPPFTDGRRTADPSNPRGYFEHDRVKSLARASDWISAAEGHALKVVAPLLAFLPVGPAYRVVFVEREMDEVLRSQAAMLRSAGQIAAREDVLRPVFARQLNEAKAWAEVNGESVKVIEHRALIERPTETARELASFVGGSLDVSAMTAAVDPTLYRQRLSDGG